MKTLYTLMASLCITIFMLPSCKKSKYNGSPYTEQMCHSYNFKYKFEGYYPPTQQYVTYTVDTVKNISFVNPSTVIFSSNTYIYDSISANGILHYHDSANFVFEVGRLDFDHINNLVSIALTKHKSAAAGNWLYYYSSY